jgi:ribosomal protein L34E
MEKFLFKTMLNNIKNKASYLKTPTDNIIIKYWKKGIDLVDFESCDELLDCAKKSKQIINED